MTTTAQPSTRRLNTAKATVEAIATEMDRDENVFVMGEDVGDYGGIFSSITGLFERFGPERVIDTPISETGFIGAATEGMRPIVELMFVDFFGVCMDQIYNHMAKIHYESGGNVTVPLVLTTAVGGGYSDGAQHSQCQWGIFAHLPGMKIVVPSNPADAAGPMTAAIRDDNPVVFMFHKGVQGLPWMAKNRRSIGPVPEGERVVEIGKAAVGPPCSRCCRRAFERRGGYGNHRSAQPRAVGHRNDSSVGGEDGTARHRRRRLPIVRPARGDRGKDRRTRPQHAQDTDRARRQPRYPDPLRSPLGVCSLADSCRDQRGDPQAGEPMTEIVFPTLSENSPDTEGVVSTWFAEDGSTVSIGISSPRWLWTRWTPR